MPTVTVDQFDAQYYADHPVVPGHYGAVAAYLADRHKSILDVGCGQGEVVQIMRAAGLDASGVDFSPAALATSAAPAHCALHDVTEPWADDVGECDAMTAWFVLDCIPHDLLLQTLTNLRSVASMLYATVRHGPGEMHFGRSDRYWTHWLARAGWGRLAKTETDVLDQSSWEWIIAEPCDPAPAEQWVTVVVPAFEAQTTLPTCLRSIAEQTYPYIDLVVVEDGKADRTEEVYQEIADGLPPGAFITQEHAGAPVARNRGIRDGIGEIIVPFDADDVQPPDYVEKLVAQINAHEEAAYAYAGWTVSGHADVQDLDWTKFNKRFAEVRNDCGDVNVPYTCYISYDERHDLLWRKCAEYSPNTDWRFLLAGTWMAARRGALEACGGYDESLPMFQDRDIILSLNEHGGGVRCDDVYMVILDWPAHKSLTQRLASADGRRPIHARMLANHGHPLPHVGFVAFGPDGHFDNRLPTLRYRASRIVPWYPNATLIKDCNGLRGYASMEVAIFTRPLCPEQLGWAKQLLAMGKKVILDWTTGMGIVDQPELLLDEWCEIAHACIAATESVAQALRDRGAQDVTVIPDCVQLLGHKTVKRDYSWKGRLCWHGFGGNLASLLALGPMLNRICEDHGCLVRIIAERLPIHIPFPHELVKWEFGTADAAIVDCDIVLDPHLEGGPFLYKSDNKAVLSWALRMPVLSAPADAPIIERRLLELIGDKWVRRRAGMAGWEYVVANRTEKHFVRAVMAVVERVHSKG